MDRSITIHLGEREFRALHRISVKTGRDMEDLARCSVENEVMRTREWDEVLPPPRREMSDWGLLDSN